MLFLNGMKAKVKVIAWCVFALIAMSTSCSREVCDGEIPALGYSTATLIVQSDTTLFDTLLLTFTFKDCDGDIGLADSDTTGDFSPDSYYHYNFYLDYYEFRDTGFVKVYFPGGGYRYRIPVLSSEGRYPDIEGEIDVKVAMEPIIGDTFRFEAVLFDRALNSSNSVTTPDYLKP